MKNTMYIVILLSSFLYSQYNLKDEISKLKIMGLKVEELNNNKIKVTDGNGRVKEYYVGEEAHKNNSDDSNVTTIDVNSLDTNKYSSKFRFHQKIIGSSTYYSPYVFGDCNKNGYVELYVAGFGLNTYIYELDKTGYFKKIYTYDTLAGLPFSLFEAGGKNGIYIAKYNNCTGLLYQSMSPNQMPTMFNAPFPDSTQVTNVFFGNYDGDEYTDCIYYGDAYMNVNIREYNPITNNFEPIFSFRPKYFGQGFAISDFDNDGKIEFSGGGDNGEYYIVKNISDNNYLTVYEGQTGYHNSYLFTATNDIDSNGYKELWIGGQNFMNGTTTLLCYESVGNDKYEVKAKIILKGMVSLLDHDIRSYDVDNDGKDELLLTIGNRILILKYNGTINHQSYEVYYYKNGESITPSGQFYYSGMYDINNDKTMDLFVGIGSNQTFYTYVLLNNTATSVNERDENKLNFTLQQNYPNPFNPVTTIKCNIAAEGKYQLKIYNVLGEEITVLNNGVLSRGEHSFTFNAANLPSGVYIYRLTGNNVSISKKMMLLK